MVLLHVEELGVNELRETFHHWIRTCRYSVTGDELGELLPHLAALELRSTSSASPRLQTKAANVFSELEMDLKEQIKRMHLDLTACLQKQLVLDGDQLAKERDRILNRMLPRRYALHGDAQVFPLAVEIRCGKYQK